MPLRKVEGAVSALHQGISQQARINRYPNQCLEQVNCKSSIIDGVTTKPGSFYFTDSSIVHGDKRPFKKTVGDGTKLVVSADPTLPVAKRYLTDGTEEAVTITASALEYLKTAGAGINDYTSCALSNTETLILNRAITPAMKTEANGFGYQEGKIRHTIIEFDVEGVSGTATTIRCANEGTIVQVSLSSATTYSGEELAAKCALDFAAGQFSNLQFEAMDNFLRISHNLSGDTVEFSVTYGPLMNRYKKTNSFDALSNEALLPVTGIPGMIVPINVNGLEYTMQFQSSYIVGSFLYFSAGTWVEGVAYDSEYLLDPETMPVVYTAEGNIDVISWDQKSVGTDSDGTTPAFIGTPLTACGTCQDRLLLSYDGGVCTSRSGELRNLFPITLKTVREDTALNWIDPVANNAIHGIVNISTHLLVVGKKAQYLIDGNTALSTSSRLAESASLNIGSQIDPIVSKNKVFFMVNEASSLLSGNSKYSKAFSFTVNKDRATPSIIDFSRHVPKYVPGELDQVAFDGTNSTLVVLPKATGSTLYICDYDEEDSGEISQQAWHEWNFSSDVLNIEIVEGVLEVILKDDTTSYMELIPLAELTEEPEFILSLDCKEAVTVQGDGSVTYAGPGTPIAVVIDEGVNQYRQLTITDGKVSVAYAGYTVVLGVTFNSKYTPTIPLPKISDLNYIQSTALINDRVLFRVTDSGPLRVNTLINGVSRDQDFGTEIVGVDRNPLKSREIPVRTGAAIDDVVVSIQNVPGMYLPWKITSYDWYGRIKQKGQRM